MNNSFLCCTRFTGDIALLKSLNKRIQFLPDEHAIPNTQDSLWIFWSNLKAMLDENSEDYLVEVIYFTALMAKKIDSFAENNMLTGNATVAKILHELDKLKVCDYEMLND